VEPKNHLEIWDRFFVPPKGVCKKEPGAKSYKCTSIDAMWRVKAATELFGPCGIGWGYKVIAEGIMDGSPVLDGKGQLGKEAIHWCRIKLWYKWNGEMGELEHYGQTTLTGVYGRDEKAYFFTDEEAPKKSLTDALGKALSMLGIAGSVYMKKFDGDKYTNKPRLASPSQSDEPTGDRLTRCLNYINGAETVQVLDDAETRLANNEKRPAGDQAKLTSQERAVVVGAIRQRREELCNNGGPCSP